MVAPTIPDHTLYLAAGVGGVLAVASLVGFGLKVFVAAGQPHAVVDNLNARIKAWWFIAALFGLALAGGAAGLCTLFALASCVALREFVAPAASTPADRVLLRCVQIGVVPMQYAFALTGWFAPFALVIPLVAAIALPLLATIARAHVSLRHTSRVCAGLVVCVYLISHVPALLMPDIPVAGGSRALLVVFLVLVVQGSDVLQYLWGKLAGRRKIAPTLSPAKTVEGTVGGILSATALGALLAPITPFSVLQAAAVSLLLTLLGFGGGLALSALKRRRGIKDWGRAIHGHGGVLDRIDSLCLSAPAFFYLLRLGWVP